MHLNLNFIKSILKNVPGKSLENKVVVIECDDWGGIRTPSVNAYNAMLNDGLKIGTSTYDQFDTLEDSDDLRATFEVLSRHKDFKGNPAVMSPFINMANPDFEKIKSSGFKNYQYEVFSETYKRYKRNSDIMSVWNQGVKEGIFIPEYHGREHVSLDLWLETLQSGNESLLKAFDYQFVALELEETPEFAKAFRPNFFIRKLESLPDVRNSLIDGIHLFKETFGFKPTVFNATNGVFIDELNKDLAENQMFYNAVPRQRLVMNKTGEYRYITYKSGQISQEGIKYYIRNCNFEPSAPAYKGIGHTINQIQGAFIAGKPAIISTHRVNFNGSLDQKNRKHGIEQLDKLLSEILKKWPDVIFLSSRDFVKKFFCQCN